MKRILIALAAAAALGACTQTTMQSEAPAAGAPAAPSADAAIAAAVADSARPEADVARDAMRHPAETLAFAQIAPGQRVGELVPGGGYFTRIISRVVGPEGRVYAMVPPPQATNNAPNPIAALVETYPNITVAPQSFTTISVSEPLDVIFTAQNYHDLHLARFNLDVAAVNRAIFNAIRPGGHYVIVDHSAVAGAEIGVADTLHRIDQAIVRREVEAAGFVFEGESDVLRNPADDRTVNVFDPAIRGHTDQFIMRFRRP
ncbi:MAG: class I SAM-dependent methyltransferase [Hyphomonadaceae bacterium]